MGREPCGQQAQLLSPPVRVCVWDFVYRAVLCRRGSLAVSRVVCSLLLPAPVRKLEVGGQCFPEDATRAPWQIMETFIVHPGPELALCPRHAFHWAD